jgi:polysaccharide pyruvyl transferase WcaK-like protein
MYKHAELVMGMRLHANICSIGMGVPTLGICTYRKVADMYEDLGLGSRVLHVNHDGFEKRLGPMMEESIRQRDVLTAEYAGVKARMTARAERFFSVLELFGKQAGKGGL